MSKKRRGHTPVQKYNPMQGRVMGLVQHAHRIENIMWTISDLERERRDLNARIAEARADLQAEKNRLHNLRDEFIPLLAEAEAEAEAPVAAAEQAVLGTLGGVNPGVYRRASDFRDEVFEVAAGRIARRIYLDGEAAYYTIWADVEAFNSIGPVIPVKGLPGWAAGMMPESVVA